MKKPLLMIYYTIIIRIHLHFSEAMSLSGMTNYAKLICEKEINIFSIEAIYEIYFSEVYRG